MGRRAILLLVAVVIAALGATLVFLYVQGVEQKADDERDLVQVVGATETITAGESADDAMASGKIDFIEVPQDQLVDGYLTSTESLSGTVALTTVYPGEQILQSRFGATTSEETLPIPKGLMAVSVQLTDPARVAGYVTPGSHVAIFLSATPEPIDAQGNSQVLPDFTRLLFPEVEVIGVGSTTLLTSTTTDESGSQTTEQIPRTILTLAVTQAQAERIIFAAGHGEVSFGLLTDQSVVKPDKGVTADDLFR